MMRCLKLCLVLAALVAAGWQSASSAPRKDPGYASVRERVIVRVGEEGRGGFFWRRRGMRDYGDRDKAYSRDRGYDRDRDVDRGGRGEGRKFWGGPYWGYGARLGHPCEVCRSSCRGEDRGSYCERCRARCGW